MAKLDTFNTSSPTNRLSLAVNGFSTFDVSSDTPQSQKTIFAQPESLWGRGCIAHVE